jgi:NitT/TauT family transport system permease protein
MSPTSDLDKSPALVRGSLIHNVIDTGARFSRHDWRSVVRSALPRFANVEGALGPIVLIVLWQVASYYFPPIFFPSLQRIWDAGTDLLGAKSTYVTIALSAMRIFLALMFAFAAGTSLGIGASLNRHVERILGPLIELKQGIPAVCWIIFAALWFRNIEVRITFVVIITALPVFFYQARDSIRAISSELWQMVRSLRPGPWKMLRILLLPAMLPSMISGWRINVGNAVRVTIMTELLSGTSGLGYELRLSQEMFRMDQVIVWTLVLASFVVISNFILSVAETKLLKWRPKHEANHA